VILSLREFANTTLDSAQLPAEVQLDVHGKGPGQVAMETLWACRTCMACVEVCPVAIEHVPIIVQMRRKLVEEGQMDPLLRKTLQTIHKTGNSFGESRRKRAAWTKSAAVCGQGCAQGARRCAVVRRRLCLLRSSQPEGDGRLRDAAARRLASISAFSTRASPTPATMCGAWEGGPVRVAGRVEHQWRSGGCLVQSPSSPPTRTPTTRFATSIPTSAAKFAIEHYTTLLLQLLQQGRLPPRAGSGCTVTFHDPCHLGRFNKGYEAPREILRLLGCELVEMQRCRANSFCCGAGGGRIWIPDPVGAGQARAQPHARGRGNSRGCRSTWSAVPRI
jgi:ferredoxin